MVLLSSAADWVGSKVNGWKLGGGHSVEHSDVMMNTKGETLTCESELCLGIGVRP
jgi:hypothetical protein